MSKLTHTVATDALATLGTIIDETAGRDAIHLAVEPVIAAHMLSPGQDVSLNADHKAVAAFTKNIAPVGIVDPFLNEPVMPGQRFWLIVYPRQITSLRHVWSHPNFPEIDAPKPAVLQVDPKAASEAWLQNYANAEGLHVNQLVEAAVEAKHEGYLMLPSGTEGHGQVDPALWLHLKIARDIDPPADTEMYFSCAC